MSFLIRLLAFALWTVCALEVGATYHDDIVKLNKKLSLTGPITRLTGGH